MNNYIQKLDKNIIIELLLKEYIIIKERIKNIIASKSTISMAP